MSFFSSLTSSIKNLTTGFVPQRLAFGDIQVLTTALLAEGGYSYVYSAREVGMQARQFAVKKVLAQDAETDTIATVETSLLQKLDGHPGFVRCHGVMSKQMTKTTKEYWMLLELCPHGSLVDVLYRKGKGGAFEKKSPLPTIHVLEIFEMVAAAVTHMHALSPAVSHRDLKLENVLGASDGRWVLCDFGSATTRVLPASRTRKEAVGEEEAIHKYSTLMYR